MILTRTRIDGLPVLYAYAHLSAGSGDYTTYVFDGHEDKAFSSVFLTTRSLDGLFKELTKLPKLTDARKVLTTAPGASHTTSQPTPNEGAAER